MTDYKKLTVPKLKALLDERGVEYPSKCKKADLLKLAQESEGVGGGAAEDAAEDEDKEKMDIESTVEATVEAPEPAPAPAPVPSAKKVKTSHPPTSPLSASTSTVLALPPVPNYVQTLPSPNLSLTGHTSSVYTLGFAPGGVEGGGLTLATGSYDGTVMLWNLGSRSCSNYNVLTGFKNAVTQLCWLSPSTLITSSADKSLHLFDCDTGTRIRKLPWHKSIVNCCDGSPYTVTSNVIVSGGDDRVLYVGDDRSRNVSGSIQHEYQVTACKLGTDGNTVYTGGVDNIVRAFDIRMMNGGEGKGAEELFNLQGHTDTITGITLGGIGSMSLYTNSMDSTIRAWDVSPYASSNNRTSWCNSTNGTSHDSEKRLLRIRYNLTPSGEGLITAGSSDGCVSVIDGDTGVVKFKLPGHKGAVTDAEWKQGVLASGGVDRQVIVGEL